MTQSKEDAKAPALATPQKTITICALRDHSFEVAFKLLKDSTFEEDNDINVKAILLEYAPMERAHELELSTKAGSFDIVSIDQPSLGKYVTNEWIRSLDTFADDPTLAKLDLDDIAPSLLAPCGTWNKKLYAIPLGSYGALVAYRSDIFSSNNLQPPRTFEEFRKYARKLNSPPTLYGTALFAHKGEYITADAAPFLWSWGAGLINSCDVNLSGMTPYRAAWNTTEGIAALEFYASLYKKNLTPPDTLSYDHERYIRAFQQGKVAMGIMPAEGIGAPMENPKRSLVAGKIRYANLPVRKKGDGSLSTPYPGLGAHSLAIAAHSKNPKEAYMVIQFLTGTNIGKQYIRNGGRPFRKSHFSKESLSTFPYFKAMKQVMETGRCRPNIPEYPAVSKIFFTAFHSALKHNAPVAEVMKAAAIKANNEILIPAYPHATGRVK